MKKLRYYITGHGLGHASRSCQVINTLRRRHPKIAVEVVSDAHDWFFDGFLDAQVPVRRRRLDIGVRQRDSLVMDKVATVRAYGELLERRGALIAEEARSLEESGVNLVAADIPALAFAASRAANLPSVGISNFSWDWIYREMAGDLCGCDMVVRALREDYSQADYFLRLPFHAPCDAFATIEDLPLVARRATRDPASVRRLLGIPADGRVGLVSFGGFGLDNFDFSSLAKIRGWFFITERGLAAACDNIRIPTPGHISYPDLIGAADAVLTKPGYGIVSEAIANRTAVLYTSRGDFPEQPLLVAGLRRYCRVREIDNARLRSGEWEEDLACLLDQPEPVDSMAAHGDLVAADRLAQLIENL